MVTVDRLRLKGPVKSEGAEERGLLQACRSPSALKPGAVETASLPTPVPGRGRPSEYERPRLQPPKRKSECRGKTALRGLAVRTKIQIKIFLIVYLGMTVKGYGGMAQGDFVPS
jgi:hypothetical protein